jgi:uncharacterized protein (TIGR00251 family)
MTTLPLEPKTIQLKVTPNSSKSEVKLENGVFRVKLKSKPVDGKANLELVKLLAEHFRVPTSSIRILRGLKSRDKVVQVTGA